MTTLQTRLAQADKPTKGPEMTPDNPDPLDVEVIRAPILKGVGKITGDGWKDTTKIDEVVFVWNDPLPPPYAPGQYPRIGNEIWAASWDQYDFTPATVEDARSFIAQHYATVIAENERLRTTGARLPALDQE